MGWARRALPILSIPRLNGKGKGLNKAHLLSVALILTRQAFMTENETNPWSRVAACHVQLGERSRACLTQDLLGTLVAKPPQHSPS